MSDDAVTDTPEEAPSARPSAGRRVGKWLLRIAVAVAIVIAAGVAVLNSPIGQRFITDQIAKVAPASGLKIKIGRIEGDLYGEAVLHDVVLSDPKGKFLEIPRVELDWRPFNWFTSGLDVRKLVTRRGTLLRLPELNPGDPDAPILPDFDIRIDRLEIDNLTLAAGVAGEQPQKLNLLAKSDIRDGRVYVKADGKLGNQDTLAALIDAEPDADKFDINVDYNAPKGGALATMIGTADGYRARVFGDGSWSKWDGGIYVTRDEARVAALKLTNRSGDYSLLGQVSSEGLLTGLPADALGETVSLAANGTLVDSVLAGNAELIGAALRADADGNVDLAGNSFDDFAVNAVLTDPRLLGPDLLLQGTRLSATIDGPFRDLSIAHELTLERLVSGDTELAGVVQQGTASFDGTRWTVPLDAAVARVVTGNDFADPRLVGGTVGGTVVYTGGKLLSDDLAIRFPGAAADLALRGDVTRGGYALAGPVSLNGLQFDDLGTVDANAKIRFSIGSGVPWKLRANFAGRMPRVTNGTLANLAGDNIRFRGAVGLGGAEALAFNDVRLEASKLRLTLDGRIADGATTLAGNGNHTQYGDFTVEGELAADGPRAVLVFANPLPAAGLIDVRVALSPIENGFGIETSGGSLLGPFDGNLNLFAPEGGPTRVAIERLEVWKTDVTGDITLGDAGASGTLALAGGGLDGTIALAPRGGGQGFDINLLANRASFGGETPISIAQGRIEAAGLLVDGNSTITGSAFAQGITYGNIFVGKLAARTALENGSGDFTASLSGRRGSRFNLQLQGDVAPERFAVSARGDFAGRNISMPRRAVLLKQDNGGWQLQPTQLSYGNGVAIAEGSFGGGGPVAMEVKLSKMPLSLVDVVVADLGLGGTISGLVDFRSNGSGAPVGNARVQVSKLTRSGLVLSSRPVNLALVGNLTAARLDMRAVIDDADGDRLGRVQGRVTNFGSGDGLYERLSRGNLLAQLRYSGPADALWRLAAVDAFDLTGPVRVAADVTGTFENPNVRGSLASENLRLQSSLSGTDITGIKARGNFAGSLLRLTSFAGKAANGGTVSGSGTVDLSGLGPRGPKIDLRAAANNAQLLNGNGISATITGPLRIVSNGLGGTIAGRVKINKAAWKLGTAADDVSLPDIKTREINQRLDVRPSRASSRPWRYLIDAKGSSRIDVDGMGLDSEWGADIILRGTTSDPRIGGEARVVRGQYSFAGTRFELTRGRIVFDASVPVDPRLDILAETETDGLDVQVTVTGNAQSPEIAFSSTPALPEEELLARLLFGGSITSLSATDALQLGAALASLRGDGGGGLDPINSLRTAIGLDRLRIVGADPALNRQTGVALGKNFGRKFYVEIITDGRGYSATELEFRVTRWLSLLAAVSTVGRQSATAEISRDY
ncbi:translocation/assembly module TamB domain-containing protein [Altererythrobacter sp. ZODW24]|uniref:translocation/assembly module TamB domain-containing protein n=1 Tax=Altererythrobacter sp. ZODW24 TaxID=2185142 RepID=UPI000DF8678B|nr:translocation/assembly module TamB domain-containing protein [Altererythrobacter sp. ZODW24]